eukprot:jgi/Mesvir1/10528/Mv25987-RA.1
MACSQILLGYVHSVLAVLCNCEDSCLVAMWPLTLQPGRCVGMQPPIIGYPIWCDLHLHTLY